jgi:antitoxin (DNA-binding transcriptional repressor) of toxin-antitoxin stability system
MEHGNPQIIRGQDSHTAAQVAQGEEFTITRHGKPVARLVPTRPGRAKPDVRASVESKKQFRMGHSLGKGRTVRDLIEEGRRF